MAGPGKLKDGSFDDHEAQDEDLGTVEAMQQTIKEEVSHAVPASSKHPPAANASRLLPAAPPRSSRPGLGCVEGVHHRQGAEGQGRRAKKEGRALHHLLVLELSWHSVVSSMARS